MDFLPTIARLVCHASIRFDPAYTREPHRIGTGLAQPKGEEIWQEALFQQFLIKSAANPSMQKKPLWKTVAFAFGLGLSVLSNSGHAAREGRATLCRAFYAEATLESLGQLSRQLQNRLE